jgi:SAM-dependent methyltransferase
MPYERRPILDFVLEVAANTPPGAVVLDVGAGDAPYRELFAHAAYTSNDWAESVHTGGQQADLIAPATALPLEDRCVDVVLCTQVLEHVADPALVCSELFRVLRPGGTAALTVPLVWQLHELPHDYFRYTAPGIEHLLSNAGFSDIEVRARNDSFTTLAQMLLNVAATLGRAPDGLDPQREAVPGLVMDVAEKVAALAPLDVERALPLGYSVLGRRPS